MGRGSSPGSGSLSEIPALFGFHQIFFQSFPLNYILNMDRNHFLGLPCGPAVKTACFHCKGHRFDPLGN